MNRLAIRQAKPNHPVPRTSAPEWISGESRPCSKAVFVPLKYEPKHAYPLFVWLHDAGQAESSVRDTMPLISLRNFLAVGPRGATTPGPSGATASADNPWQQTIDGIQFGLDCVQDCIRSIGQRYQVAKSQVFIAGWGQGGTMALRLAFDNPHLFAGCASLGGPFPNNLCPLRRINESRGMDVLLSLCEDFPNYNGNEFCDNIRLMYLAGANLHVRQYHNKTTTVDLRKVMLGDLNRWMMGLLTNQNLFETADIPLQRRNLDN